MGEQRRFRRMGENEDGVPVIVLDMCFGKFVTSDISPLDCIRAWLRFWEEFLEELRSKNTPLAAMFLFIGGPPPMVWARALILLGEKNYPAIDARAVVYPVPSMLHWLFWLFSAFVPREQRGKVALAESEQEVCTATG